MSLIKFQCPTCGAPLEDPGKGTTMRCTFCSTSILVPVELISARSAISSAPPPEHQNLPPSNVTPSNSSSQMEVYYQDDLSKPDNGWEVGKFAGGVSLSFENDSYRFLLTEDSSGWEAYIDDEFDDFDLEVDIAQFKGAKDGEFGIISRVDDDGGYSFWITADGYFGICKFYFGETDDAEYKYIDLADGHSNILQTGNSFNHLRVICFGKNLTMFINGKKVLEATDNEFKLGDIALSANTGESDKGGLDIRFKNLIIREAK